MKNAIMRIRQYFINRRIWREYKKYIIATWGQPGFQSINYKGVPMEPEIITPSLPVDSNGSSSSTKNMLDELMTEIQQPTTPHDLDKLKMDIINRKIGA